MYRYVYSILETLIENRLQALMLMNRLFALCGFYVFKKKPLSMETSACVWHQETFIRNSQGFIYIVPLFLKPHAEDPLLSLLIQELTCTRGKSNDLSGLQLSLFKHIFFIIKLTAHLHGAT